VGLFLQTEKLLQVYLRPAAESVDHVTNVAATSMTTVTHCILGFPVTEHH